MKPQRDSNGIASGLIRVIRMRKRNGIKTPVGGLSVALSGCGYPVEKSHPDKLPLRPTTFGEKSMSPPPILEPEVAERRTGVAFAPATTYRVRYRTESGAGTITVPWCVLSVYERFREAVSRREGREVRDAFYDDCPVEWLGDLGGAILEGLPQ